MPLETNPSTCEPYLRLPSPYSHILITPPRPNNDVEESTLVAHMNDPRVYTYLENPPHPYLAADARSWLEREHGNSTKLLDAMKTDGGLYVDGCPFTCIREEEQQLSTTENAGAEKKDLLLIGNVSLTRYQFYEFRAGSEERKEAVRRNEELPVGSREIVWGFGDWLTPTHHGKGIMSAVIKCVIEDWAIPRMNARILKASMYAENLGSVKVFRKNGFEMEYDTLKDWAIVPQNRGGGRKSIHVMLRRIAE